MVGESVGDGVTVGVFVLVIVGVLESVGVTVGDKVQVGVFVKVKV
jgi:hypothetical protein